MAKPSGEPTLDDDEYDDWAAAWEWAARAEDSSFTVEERIRAALRFLQSTAVSMVEKQQKKQEWATLKHEELAFGLIGQVDMSDIPSSYHSLMRELLGAKNSFARFNAAAALISSGRADAIQAVELMFSGEPEPEVRLLVGWLLGSYGHASGIEFMNDQFQKLITGEPLHFRAEIHSYDFYRAAIAHFAARQGNRVAAEYCADLFATTSCVNTLKYFAFVEIPGQFSYVHGVPTTRDSLVRHYKRMAEE